MPMMRRSTGVGGVAPRTTGRITKIWNAVSNRSLNARKPSKRKVRDSRYNVEEASAGAAGIAEVPQLTDVNFMSNEGNASSGGFAGLNVLLIDIVNFLCRILHND